MCVRVEAAEKTYVVTYGQTYSTRRNIDSLARGLGTDPTPRFRLPVPMLVGAPRAGDVATRITGRRMPFDSHVLDRLIGNAEYASGCIQADLGFRPTVNLDDEATEMARTHRQGP